MPRKKIDRDIRREALVDAARQFIFRNGFDESNMDEIAIAADCTRRTLYTYFKSRDELCLLVFLDGLRLRVQMQRSAMASAPSGLARLRRWGEAFHEFAQRYPEYLRIQLYWDYKGIDQYAIGADVFAEFRELNEEIIEDLRSAFRAGIDEGSIRADLPVDMTISQYVYTLRSVLNKALFPAFSFARFDGEEYVRRYLDLFTGAIASHAQEEK